MSEFPYCRNCRHSLTHPALEMECTHPLVQPAQPGPYPTCISVRHTGKCTPSAVLYAPKPRVAIRGRQRVRRVSTLWAIVGGALVLAIVAYAALSAPRIKLFDSANGATCVAVIGQFGQVALSCDWSNDGSGGSVKTRGYRS
ncbi:hypothetical protein [Burkholderia gladioli]|uniref:hypothetical protein n=1 Tax=Burkholderia gladioli TaxID=28095 RepID=UPI0016408540|nr:hypothetical protein [Burkholderia gladioli]